MPGTAEGSAGRDSAGVNPKPSALRAGLALLKETAAHWMEDNALRLSAALAYYSIFSIAPLLVLAVGLAGWLLGEKAVSGHLSDELQGLMGYQASQAMQTMIASASKPSQSLTATIVGLVTLLVGASGVFGQLKDALNTIWEVRPKPGLGIRAFVRERLLTFGMVLVIGFLLLVSLLLSSMLSALTHWMKVLLHLPDWLGGAGLIASFAVVTLLFALIFKVLPDVKIAWKHVWIGAATTAFFFEIGKFGLAFYLGRESTTSSFGSAGSVVLLLLWVYYASCILLFGAEFTKVYAAAQGARLQPTELAIPVTIEARLQQGMQVQETQALDTPTPPRRESLAALFPKPPVESAQAEGLAAVNEYLLEHPAASLLAALGCGLTAGFISRITPTHHEEPAAQVQKGSRLIGAAILVLAMRFRKAIFGAARDALANTVRNRLPRFFARGQ
jgi:membrane protein